MRLFGRDRDPGRFTRRRQSMIRDQLQARGISQPGVLAAMARIPRERFVPAEYIERAYHDGALTIGNGQTISQPYMVARMTEALALPEDAGSPPPPVLDIGTGSGYQAAILAELGAHVVSMERDPELAAEARGRLAELGYERVQVELGDGSAGWPAGAPYRGILVAAACPEAPEPLLAELQDGGRLVAPIGSRDLQELTIVRRVGSRLETEVLEPCVFVPLVGRFGFSA